MLAVISLTAPRGALGGLGSGQSQRLQLNTSVAMHILRCGPEHFQDDIIWNRKTSP